MSEAVELTLGIDLAAQNRKTAACLVEWHANHAVARSPVRQGEGESDDWLIRLAQEATSIGIDAPFGWPEPFVTAVPEWAAGGRWTTADKADLRFRLTDQIVSGVVGRTPLSVSSDRIAITAWRCARLLDRLRPENGRPLSRIGADRVFEVYPGAALTCWGFRRGGYKTSGSSEAKKTQQKARVDLIAEMRSRAGWLNLDAVAEACETSDDALDARIASLVTRAATTGRTRAAEPANADDRRRIEREGWIHLPKTPETFGELLAD